MKRILTYGGVILSFYLLFLVATIPAAQVYKLVREKIPQVTLYDVSGTIWSGQADAAVINGKPYREFEWTLQLWRIIFGRLEADVTFDNNDSWADGKVGVGLGGDIVVTDLSGQLPAQDVKAFVPKLPAQLDGVFRLALDKVVYSPEDQMVSYAEGHVDWQDAAVTVVQKADIGDFQLDLTTTDGGINGVFSDVNDGPLIVQGSATLSLDKQYQLDTKLKVRDTSRRDLVQSLGFLGKKDAQGNVVINQSGSL